MPKIGQINGPLPLAQLDDTDKLAVSLYGKGTVAGDTALAVISTTAPVLRTALYNAAGQNALLTAPVDALAAAIYTQYVSAVGMLYNGATFDRARANEALTGSASAARTAELVGADQVNYNGRGVLLIVNVTARAAASTLTPKLHYKDPVSGEYKLFWTAAAAINTADDTFAYLFYPHAVPAAPLYTEHQDIVVPRTWRYVVTPSDANSVTYSVAVVTLL